VQDKIHARRGETVPAINSEIALKIRNGLFLASSRTYGEQYIEPFIRSEFFLKEPDGNDHDGVDSKGIKYEIKASKVLSVTDNLSKSKSLYERILFENSNLETSRLIPFAECRKSDYGANIQNVKRDHFEFLVYVLLFEDCLKVFKIKSHEISEIPSWSNKHGRYDQLGKSGQFPIHKGNIEWHLKTCLLETYDYEHLASVYRKLH
jgi:hypothetical protein